MRYQAILFDMDGTLVPMDMERFARAYFKALAAELAPFGVAPDALVKAIWAGTEAMIRNDGSRMNADAFWDVLTGMTGVDRAQVEPVCDAFYTGNFNLARAATEANPLAPEAIRLAHEKADLVVLATNPLFPMAAQTTRMGWVGLRPEDFALVTCYSSDRFCKPNPAYYRDVCARLGLDPQRCLMIGNDDREDMYTAASVGMDCYLITNWRIPQKDKPWTGPQGTFEEMLEMLRGL